MKREQLPALTGIRAFAALAVVLLHVARPAIVHAESPDTRGLARLPLLLQSGYLGVDVFFILSGFVLAYTYTAGAELRGGIRPFLAARIARIAPAYLVAWLVAAIPVLGWGGCTLGVPDCAALPRQTSALLTLAAFQSWVPFANGWDAPSWSVSDEMLFYALFPLLLPALSRLRTTALVAALGLCWVAACAPPLVLQLADRTYAANVLGSTPDTALFRLVAFSPPARLPEFALGVALGALWVRGAFADLPARLWGPLTALSAALALCAAAAALVLPYGLVHGGLLDPVFAGLILCCAAGRGPLCRVLAAPLPVLLGEASYALYLLHAPLWAITTHLLPMPAGAGPATCYVALFVLFALSLSVLVYRLVETPARRAIRGRLTPSPAFYSVPLPRDRGAPAPQS